MSEVTGEKRSSKNFDIPHLDIILYVPVLKKKKLVCSYALYNIFQMIIFKRYYNQIKPFFRQIYFSNLTFCSPLVTGELLQNMVDVTSVTYQVNSIEI